MPRAAPSRTLDGDYELFTSDRITVVRIGDVMDRDLELAAVFKGSDPDEVATTCAEVRRRISDCDGRLVGGYRIRTHLRKCPACSAFAAAIPHRRRSLRSLGPPLTQSAAKGLLARVVATSGLDGDSRL
jgi:hypothetical protein